MSPDKPARAVFELRLVGRAGQAGIHDLRAPPARAECRPVRTARSWRGIVSFTHLAREGRMTVTIRRRELLAALGGTAVAWAPAARAPQPGRPGVGDFKVWGAGGGVPRPRGPPRSGRNP